METIRVFESAAGVFRTVLAGVRTEQHQLPTPCEPLDVSGLVSERSAVELGAVVDRWSDGARGVPADRPGGLAGRVSRRLDG